MKIRNVMYIVIGVICIIAIILGVYYQMFSKKVVKESQLNEVTNNVDDEPDVDDPENLLLEFNKLFKNNIYTQGYSTAGVTKLEGQEEKDVIYSAYNVQEDIENKYSVDLKIPVFNIQSEVAEEYNSTTQAIFADKASNIFMNVENLKKYTIYNVEYVAYLNENILSLVIRSILKEGNSAQRVIVQTYNYDIQTNKKVTLNEVLEKKNIKEKDVNKKIERQVKEASKQAEEIAEATGQIVYKRDINNAMYITDNVSNFFIGKDGQIYIIYAYGNNNVTSEIDIIKL
ncbi:MAG: hypothetical protein HFJ42_03910 [Clostridia bacterium]|nr:hypothetical protein [Clostridia bacterium]